MTGMEHCQFHLGPLLIVPKFARKGSVLFCVTVGVIVDCAVGYVEKTMNEQTFSALLSRKCLEG